MEASKKWHDKIQLWVAMGSLVIAITSITIQVRTRTRELSCNIISSSELTSVSQIPGLTSSFIYRGTPVIHLWKVGLLFVNTGSEILIGEGGHSSLIGDGILIGFSNHVEILNVEPTDDRKDFRFEKQSTNTFKLKFSQWFPDEKANVLVYLTSSDDQLQPIMPEPMARDIAEGKIIVRNATQLVLTKPPSTIEKFPAILRIPTKMFMGFLAVFFVFFGFIGIPAGIINYARQRQWRRRYFGIFIEYIKTLALPNSDRISSNPRILPNELWKNFRGERYPRGSIEIDSFGELFVFCAVFIAFGIIGTVLLLSLLGDWFPKLAAHI